MKTGEIVTCRVEGFPGSGVNASGPDGETVFINVGDVSWLRFRHVESVLAIGQKIPVLITREPIPNHKMYLGSIKDAGLKDDPWREDRIYKIGARLRAKVYHLDDGFLVAILPTRAEVAVSIPRKHFFKVGDLIQVKLTSVCPVKRQILGELIL